MPHSKKQFRKGQIIDALTVMGLLLEEHRRGISRETLQVFREQTERIVQNLRAL